MHVMQPTSGENVIQYPDHISEFEVHSELFFSLKASIPGSDIRAEIKSRGTHGLRKAKTACRFDIVAFFNKKPICIVEVKGNKVRHKTCMEDTRQGVRYVTYGVPVIMCYGARDIEPVVEFVMSLYQKVMA